MISQPTCRHQRKAIRLSSAVASTRTGNVPGLTALSDAFTGSAAASGAAGSAARSSAAIDEERQSLQRRAGAGIPALLYLAAAIAGGARRSARAMVTAFAF